MDPEKAKQQRAEIRRVFANLPGSRPLNLADHVKILLEMTAFAQSGQSYVRPIASLRHLYRAVGPEVLQALADAIPAMHMSRFRAHVTLRPDADRGIPSKADTQEAMRLQEFGVQTSLFMKGGMGKTDALNEAAMALGYPSTVSTRTLYRWFGKFEDACVSSGFVPYFDLDPETGTLAPTQIVLEELKGKPGAPKGKRKP